MNNRVIAIYHEKDSDVIRIEKETSEGKQYYDYFPIADFTDVHQLEIMANKIYKLKF